MHTLRIFVRGIFKASSKGCSVGQHYSSSAKPSLNMNHALVVSKLSRYEFEQYRNPNLSEDQLEALLRKRGSDFDIVIKHHRLHKDFEKKIENALERSGIETKVVNRFTYTEESIEWADVIIVAGGDGTFLLAASRIAGNAKPVIGFNSDPSRSEGHLCLPKKYSENYLEAIEKLKKGEFNWKFRSRIRITLCGNDIFYPPVELHEQELLEPQHRYFDCITEQQKIEAAHSVSQANVRVLPVLALNEVFIGENLSARVSYFELNVDGKIRSKVKSSGLCICTGTGSTSWHTSINQITHQTVAEIANLLGKTLDASEAHRITKCFNDCLVFSPEDKRMYYTIRDLISTDVWPNPKGIEPRGYASYIQVKSRCIDAGLVIDGGISFHFNDGSVAILEIHDSDALRTVSLIE
ncbi:NAD kinase 2, mitochondrial [Anabrus simplex]|uniref:NAD kinase 2, mitochondrial n=1 Tax=Anabrus simplex TaxID=316456 RepID=UPI0034DDA790